MWTMRWLLLLGLTMLPAYCSADCAGKVLAALEGDKLVLDCDGPIQIVLEGIDAPEVAQPAGREAQFFVSTIAVNQIARVHEKGKDENGITRGDVLLESGINLNQEIIRAGLAWYYEGYSKNQILSDLEKEARSKKIGLWIDDNPEAPWDYRRRIASQELASNNSKDVLGQEKKGEVSDDVVKSTGSFAPAEIPKLPRYDYLGRSFRYPQHRINNVENEEYGYLSTLETLTRDQVARFVILERKRAIADGFGGGVVYIIRGEDEYHKVSCPRLGKTPDNYVRTPFDYVFPISLNRAKLAFYPCPICNPPQE